MVPVIDVGGLVGSKSGSGTSTNSYWDNQTSRYNTSVTGTGKLTSQMKDILTFSGWNIVSYLGVNLNNDDIQALLDEITTLRQTVLDTQTALKG